MRRRGALLGTCGASAGLAALMLSACGDPATDKATPICKDGTLENAINNGSDEATFLQLGEDELASVLFVQSYNDGKVTSCSGVLVDELWAVTARHCIMENAQMRVQNSRGLAARVSSLVLHETADVALLSLDTSLPGARPIAIATARAPDYVRSKAEVAGFGFDARGVMGNLAFQVVTVLDVSSSAVVVTGDLSGACFGDSGAPLLSRGADGRPVVLGTLSGGSATCTGIDEYVRADTLADWFGKYVRAESAPPRPASCAEVGQTGRCYGKVAAWCEDGLRTETCKEPKACGWSSELGRFGCTEVDACAGADALGVCNDNEIHVCSEGLLSMTLCECGFACAIDGASGRASCVDASSMPQTSL